MRNGLYYLVAFLLLLATVPMYRYILDRSRREATAPVVGHMPDQRAVLPRQKTWYRYGEALPPGYKCSAAGGPVYRTREEKGSTVVDPLYRDGVMVRCGGDERSSYR